MTTTSDLLPQSSGSASIGVNQVNGIGGMSSTIRPYNHIHVNSGVFHNPYGSSGVIRFTGSQFEVSVDGGRTFSNVALIGGNNGEVYFNDNGSMTTNQNFTFVRFGPGEATVGVSGVIDLRSRTILRGSTASNPGSGVARIIGVDLARNPLLGVLSSGSFMPRVFQPALFNKQIFMIFPNTGGTIDSFGNTLTSVGTATHPTPNVNSGVMVNQVTGGTAGNTAGTGSAALLFFRGGLSGINTGFFFATRMTLPDATYDRIRVFCGLTTGTLATAVGSDDFAGDYCGFQYSNVRGDLNWQFVTKDNSTQRRQETNIFCSGQRIYDMYIYSPPFPSNGAIYWTLQDITNNTEVNGTAILNLPRINQAMRSGLQMSNVVAVARNIRYTHLYTSGE